MGERIKVEDRRGTPGARHHVVLGPIAVGDTRMRGIGNVEQECLDALIKLGQTHLVVLDTLLEGTQRRALLGRGCAANGGRRRTLLRTGLLDSGAQRARSCIELEQLVDRRDLPFPARAVANRVGVVPNALQLQHQESELPSPPRCCGRIVGKSKTSRMVAAPVSSITSRSTPRPSPPAGGMPTSIASRKSSSIGGISESHAARSRASSSNRARWSIGSLSSLNALASSRPAMISSKRSTKRGSSRRS